MNLANAAYSVIDATGAGFDWRGSAIFITAVGGMITATVSSLVAAALGIASFVRVGQAARDAKVAALASVASQTSADAAHKSFAEVRQDVVDLKHNTDRVLAALQAAQKGEAFAKGQNDILTGTLTNQPKS